MTSRLNPYISFRDNAREAMTFYQEVFGGVLNLSTFGEYGDPVAADADLIMHGQLEAANGFTLMGSDTLAGMERPDDSYITVSLSGEDAEELTGYWERLSRGAEVTMPLERQMWGDDFGQLTDRFGVQWMVNIVGTAA